VPRAQRSRRSAGHSPGRTPGQSPGTRVRVVEETSAGGLVIEDPTGAARGAVIGRYDRRGRMRWSLPKGHLEPGETAEQAAVREVAEETGIRGRVIAPLGSIDFTFLAEDHRVHKTVHHFLLVAEGGELSRDDPEVESVAWVPLAELARRLSYDDERRLLDTVPQLLMEAG
jgi:8-oxo-dGTP pyrophosphatase MutT (NUDIX family)